MTLELTPTEVAARARHEAGHVLANLGLGLQRLGDISIGPPGRTQYVPLVEWRTDDEIRASLASADPDERERAERCVYAFALRAAAGEVAEGRTSTDFDPAKDQDPGNDFPRAVRFIAGLHADRVPGARLEDFARYRRPLNEVVETARTFLDANEPQLDAVARLLAARRLLPATESNEAVAACLAGLRPLDRAALEERPAWAHRRADNPPL